MVQNAGHFPRRLGALFIAALMTVTANPEISSAFIAMPDASHHTNRILTEITQQALTAEPAGGRYGVTTLRLSARLKSLRSQWHARSKAAFTGDAPAPYNAGRRAQALQNLVDRGGFIIPMTSLTRMVYQPDGTKRKSEYFGILSLTLHDPVFQQQLIATQKKYRELLDEIIREQIGKIPPGESSEQTKKELEATKACLVELDPDAFHFTVAGIRNDTSLYFHNLRSWNLRRQIAKRTRDVARFGREIILLHNGRIRKLVVGTPAIAIELKWETFKDNLRFIALQDAYAAYFPHDTEIQVPHITLEFIRGQWDPHLEEWVVTPLQNQCIDEARRRLERDNQLEMFNATPLAWKVNQLDVVRSKDLDTPGTEEGPPVKLMSKESYEAAQDNGKETLLKAWKSANQNEKSLPWDEIKATLGLFQKYYLHNQRSLLAAIANRAVSASRVISLVLHAKKLRVRFKGYSAVSKTSPATASYRLTAENDRPGLLLAISSVIDQYAGNLANIEFVKVNHEDPGRAKTAMELTVVGLTEKEAIALWTSLEAIPDLGHRIIGMESLYELGRRIVDRFSGMQIVHLEFRMDARNRKAGDPSRRTLMLQAMLNLDARCSVSQFSVERNDENVIIHMTAHVPRSVANRVSIKLRHDAGLPNNPSREIHERSTFDYLYDIPEFLRIVALRILRFIYPFALRVKLVELLGYAREHDLSLPVMNDLWDVLFIERPDYFLDNNRLAWLRPYLPRFHFGIQSFQNLEGLTLSSTKSDHRFITAVKFSPWDGSWLLQLKDTNSRNRVIGWLRLRYSMGWPVLRIVNDGFSRNSLDVDLMGQLVKELRATFPAAPLWVMVRKIQDLTELTEESQSESPMSEAELRVALRSHIYERAKSGPVSPSHLSSLVVILLNAGLAPLTLSAVIGDNIWLKSVGKETQPGLEANFSPNSSLEKLWNDPTLRMPHADYEREVRSAEMGFEHKFLEYFGRIPPADLTQEIRISLKSGALTLDRLSVFLEEIGPIGEKAEMTDKRMINAFNDFLNYRSEVSALQSNWPLQLPDIVELQPLRDALVNNTINSLQAYWAWTLYETTDIPAARLLRWLLLCQREIIREATRRAAQEKPHSKDRLKPVGQFIPIVEYELLQTIAYFPATGINYSPSWAFRLLAEIGKTLEEPWDISFYIRMVGLFIQEKNSALHHALSQEINNRHHFFADPPRSWRMMSSVLSARELSILQRIRASSLTLKRSA